MRRYFAFLWAGMFCVVCFSLYLMLETASLSSVGRREDLALGGNEMEIIEAKIKTIESDLQKNNRIISMIKDTVHSLSKGDLQSLQKLQSILNMATQAPGAPVADNKDLAAVEKILNQTKVTRKTVSVPKNMCGLVEQTPPKIDIQMSDVFDLIPFDNSDGGVWKQGFSISYNEADFQQRSLKVFVVPHSHCDPGWIKTFDKYYSDQTRHILNNMLEKLEANPKMRFIYAEMSFFSVWWNEIDQGKRERVKKLLSNGQLEFVTAGWVMTDEANAHYFAMLDQIIEGNLWLMNQVGAKPETGWAIDPFGHSPTMAYLLKKSGMHNMLLQRVHYSVKKYLAKNKNLEFMWRQNWDHDGSTDMMAHMMPFYSYDVPHSCGPDPKVCCQFDFKRLAGGRVTCPWKIPPSVITERNVEERAHTLLDQYKKKAQLYRSNVVLAPIGDDFRYNTPEEWEQQFRNYQTLFDYMNDKKDWNVQAQFGTLTDYFNSIYERYGTEKGGRPKDYPVLSGDFYTYADRDDHYWSGYFTSRPFYKKLDRIMEAHLRGSEIIYSLAKAHAQHHSVTTFPADQLMGRLVKARRNLGLFQHHDAITGTAKDHVVADYGVKLLNSLMDTKRVMMDSAHFLATPDKAKFTYDEQLPVFDVDETRASHDALPEKTVIELKGTPQPVIFYNSLGHDRQSVVRLYVSHAQVEVTDPSGKAIPTQVDPFFLNNEEMADDIFKVVFVCSVPALGLSRYSIKTANSNPLNIISEVTLYGAPTNPLPVQKPFQPKRKAQEDVVIENAELRVTVSGKSGLLQSIYVKKTGQKLSAKMEFVTYGAINGKEKSGAYLFLPDGDAKPLSYKPFMRAVTGPILSKVDVFIPHVAHSIRLHHSPGIDALSVDIQNIVDIRDLSNKELVMRVTTDVQNKNGEFYTDLNGFQYQRRKTLDKLPLQANFYPMPTMAYIQDSSTRFSIMSGQSLGMASLKQGWLEIVQDRRLNQDDNRGLGQGVQDNKRTPNTFRILVEHREPSKVPPTQQAGFPSLLGHLVSQEMIHPMYVMPMKIARTDIAFLPTFKPLSEELPCELHLVNLRTLQTKEEVPGAFKASSDVALILHQLGVDCSFPSAVSCPLNEGKVILSQLFQNISAVDVHSSSLSLIHDSTTMVDTNSPIQVSPMEIQAYKLHLK